MFFLTSHVLKVSPILVMIGSYAVVVVDDVNTNTKLKMKALRAYFLSSMHLGDPTIRYPDTSLEKIN